MKMKPLYEMTRAEYDKVFGKPRKNTTITGGFHPHKEAVEAALMRAIPVPLLVLADYPELRKVYEYV